MIYAESLASLPFLVSPRSSSFTLTVDKQQEVADVGNIHIFQPQPLQTFRKGAEKMQTAAAEDRQHPPTASRQ